MAGWLTPDASWFRFSYPEYADPVAVWMMRRRYVEVEKDIYEKCGEPYPGSLFRKRVTRCARVLYGTESLVAEIRER